jgi:hypothetical protein
MHHFTTANCPWSNGTIEFACKQFILACHAMLSELNMYADEWPEVVNMVQSVLNNSSFTRLNKRTPMQVFTGHTETGSHALMLKDNVPVNAPLDFIKKQKLMEIENLSKAMTEIHAQVAKKVTRDRKADFQKHNDKTHVRSPNFQVGDYLLVAEQRKSGVSRLQVKWKGPRRVLSVESDYVFDVKNLFTKEPKAAHATRLRFIRTRNSMSLRSWFRPPPSTATISSTSCRRYSTRATIRGRYFMSCWSRGAVSPLERPLGNLTLLWLWMCRTWWRSSWSRTRT